jgi:5-methylcytosine-specific restriction endonuclease McrA
LKKENRKTVRRTIRSKFSRYAVLKHFGFKCQICGCDDLSKLELDHIIPYAVTQDTNIHDQQVLCSSCNKKKGKRLHDNT